MREDGLSAYSSLSGAPLTELSSSLLVNQVISYRDHPPQDHSYVTKTLPFTSSISDVQEHLSTLYASGGGDGP